MQVGQIASLWIVVLTLVLGGSGCGVSSDVSREMGARCDEHDQCDERCLTSSRYPDGFCTVSCGSNDDCPARGVCVDIDEGVCLFSCEDTAACEFLGEGWGCEEEDGRPEGQVNVCIGDQA